MVSVAWRVSVMNRVVEMAMSSQRRRRRGRMRMRVRCEKWKRAEIILIFFESGTGGK